MERYFWTLLASISWKAAHFTSTHTDKEKKTLKLESSNQATPFLTIQNHLTQNRLIRSSASYFKRLLFYLLQVQLHLRQIFCEPKNQQHQHSICIDIANVREEERKTNRQKSTNRLSFLFGHSRISFIWNAFMQTCSNLRITKMMDTNMIRSKGHRHKSIKFGPVLIQRLRVKSIQPRK